MAACPKCGSLHMPSARVCRKCGNSLFLVESPESFQVGGKPPESGRREKSAALTAEPGRADLAAAWDLADTDPILPPGQAVLTLVAIGVGQRLRLTGQTEFTLGRTDPEKEAYIAIDLTDYGAWESGVSRRHARIYMEQNQFWLEDLRSSNGTFLNDERLEPGNPRVLSQGDMIKLGILRLYVESV